MNEQNKNVLRAGINRMLEDGYKKIKAKHLSTYSLQDVDTIICSLEDWKEKKMLNILKPYKDCHPDEYCIELLRFLDEKSPIKGYMNWENE